MRWQTQARSFAVQMLYQKEISDLDIGQIQKLFWLEPPIDFGNDFCPLQTFQWLFSGSPISKAKDQEIFQDKVFEIQEAYQNRSADDELIDLFKKLFWNDDDPEIEISVETPDHFRINPKNFLNFTKRIRQFANSLSFGTCANLSEIDRRIQIASPKWRLNRMAIVDLSIIRSASYEILYLIDLPHAISIDEAIKISKIFGTDDSPKFINGILDQIRKNAETDPIPLQNLATIRSDKENL